MDAAGISAVAARLAAVPLSAPLEALGGRRAVGRSAFAEALVGGATPGPVLWAHAQRRDGCTLPMPSDEHVLHGKLENGRRAVALLAPEAVLAAVRKILGRAASARFLASDEGRAAMAGLLERCGVLATTEAFPPFLEIVEACRRELDDERAQLAMVDPLLSNGGDAAAGRIRMIADQDSGELLVSALDLLRCAGVDKDGRGNDWRNWLRDCIALWMREEAVLREQLRLRLLKHLRLPGESNPTPMVSYAVAEKMLVECAQRGKMPPEYMEQATRLMNRFRVGDQRLHAEIDAAARAAPAEARAFVLGLEETARQQTTRGLCVAPLRAPGAQRKKRPLAALAEAQSLVLLRDLASEASGLVGAALKGLVLEAAELFVGLVLREQPARSASAVRTEYHMGTHGWNCVVPAPLRELAAGAVQSALAARLGAHAPPPAAVPSSAAARTAVPCRRGFAAVGAHAEAKDRANDEFISRLGGPGRIGHMNIAYLDAFEDGAQGFKLRTTGALLRAGARPANLYCANPHEGVVAQIARCGAVGFQGTWNQAMATAGGFHPSIAFGGVYLDLCEGSAHRAEETIRASFPRCALGCVLGWTLLQRDFDGEPFEKRLMHLVDVMQAAGWRPAAEGLLRSSTVCHRSSGNSQRVATQFWRLA
jgi:hypothetical protein